MQFSVSYTYSKFDNDNTHAAVDEPVLRQPARHHVPRRSTTPTSASRSTACCATCRGSSTSPRATRGRRRPTTRRAGRRALGCRRRTTRRRCRTTNTFNGELVNQTLSLSLNVDARQEPGHQGLLQLLQARQQLDADHVRGGHRRRLRRPMHQHPLRLHARTTSASRASGACSAATASPADGTTSTSTRPASTSTTCRDNKLWVEYKNTTLDELSLRASSTSTCNGARNFLLGDVGHRADRSELHQPVRRPLRQLGPEPELWSS